MLDVIEKLLVLQDRDRKIFQTKDELAHVDPERKEMHHRLAAAQAKLDAVKLRAKQIESDRKKLELDVEAKKQQIEKYSLQQFQTKKNEEYRALSNEIENCKKEIVHIEDKELELMEQAEVAQKEIAAAQETFANVKKLVEGKLVELEAREKNLQAELTRLDSNRAELAAAVDDSTRSRYERLFKAKGNNVVVGVQHHSCGGCHMKLSRGTVVACQAAQELVSCPNCGRLLYFTRDMDMAVAE
jgi:uncharacterized protein